VSWNWPIATAKGAAEQGSSARIDQWLRASQAGDVGGLFEGQAAKRGLAAGMDARSPNRPHDAAVAVLTLDYRQRLKPAFWASPEGDGAEDAVIGQAQSLGAAAAGGQTLQLAICAIKDTQQIAVAVNRLVHAGGHDRRGRADRSIGDVPRIGDNPSLRA